MTKSAISVEQQRLQDRIVALKAKIEQELEPAQRNKLEEIGEISKSDFLKDKLMNKDIIEF